MRRDADGNAAVVVFALVCARVEPPSTVVSSWLSPVPGSGRVHAEQLLLPVPMTRMREL